MRTLFLFLAILAFGAAPAHAASSVTTEHARTSLIAEMTGVAPGGKITLAFAQRLQPGWHVYWKNPGDSGLPLDFKWILPDGASAGTIDYPAPHRIPIGPLVNFGHEGAPVFLTGITAPADAVIGETMAIGLEATWLICAEICVPESGSFSLAVPVVAAPETNTSAASIFASARAAMPVAFDGKAFFSVGGGKLTLDLPARDVADDVYFFPAGENISEPAAPQLMRHKGDRMTLTINGGASLASLGDIVEGVVALQTNGVAAAYDVTAQRRAPSNDAAPAGPLAGFLLAAFLGGALLNLMPCVFPILFVKAASMAKSANSDKGAMRRHGVLYGLGVVATFAALAGLLLALRAGGQEVGWGFHMQSPAIVALSAYVLFAVGLNFSGAFHVGSSLQNVGSGLVAGKDGDVAALMTGVLAVFVAAPCVGPFLTAPIGAAAVLPPVAGFAIFIAMALGLAAPYVALSFAPGIARLLPKPGPWMERFRQALSFPVFAAAAYFLWVLSAQTGGRGLALGLAGLIIVALAARIWEWGRGARWGKVSTALALGLALVPVAMLRPAEACVAAVSGKIAFDPADVAQRRAAGQPVFVDFTAAWCVTCQVNKLTVLSSPKIKAAFEASDVAFVTADWTSRNPVIEQALASFGANGVPLYVYYPPAGDAVILDQPLSERGVLAALAIGRSVN